MKKKIAVLAVAVMMAMSTFSIPAYAIYNGQQDEKENCLEILSNWIENIGEKIMEFFGWEENESEESDSCQGCSFEVESADTKVWMTNIGNEYFQFEVTPVEGGMKNLKVKKLDNLDKVVYQMPRIKAIEIYGEVIFVISANDKLMSLDVTSGKIKIISDNVTQFEWVNINGKNRLAFMDNEGKTQLL